MKKEKTIYDLNLHEKIYVEGGKNDPFETSVMRVAGGWIYRSCAKGSTLMSAVFVPFDNSWQNHPSFPVPVVGPEYP